MNEYPLKDWQTSVLLKEACEHLRDQPEYIPMRPAAKIEMTRFCHAVRRALMAAKDKRGYGPYAVDHMQMEYGLILTTMDHSRYVIHVHGYSLSIICS